ncbi:hypothetical protein FDUTEX481_04081 [Tolypothrix sp. PCC 7601]|nr:hypothetical protein FDUTEX481_04081 [Tolypothrix sp. PCC 7601]
MPNAPCPIPNFPNMLYTLFTIYVKRMRPDVTNSTNVSNIAGSLVGRRLSLKIRLCKGLG